MAGTEPAPDVPQAVPPEALTPERAIELFKFYEAAAERAKDEAWSLTTWILALNAAILGFAFDFFSKNGEKPGFDVVEIACALVGVRLCVLLNLYVAGNGAPYFTLLDEFKQDRGG